MKLELCQARGQAIAQPVTVLRNTKTSRAKEVARVSVSAVLEKKLLTHRPRSATVHAKLVPLVAFLPKLMQRNVGTGQCVESISTRLLPAQELPIGTVPTSVNARLLCTRFCERRMRRRTASAAFLTTVSPMFGSHSNPVTRILSKSEP